jgi:hypothetical protein
MQIIENLSLVRGCILARRRSVSAPAMDELVVLLERASPVDARAELLHDRVGTEIVIEAPPDLLGEAAPGHHIEGHVSVVGPGRILAAPQSVVGGRFDVLPPDD